jgi:hypothetical protein
VRGALGNRRSYRDPYYKEPLAAIRSGKPWKGRLVSQRKDGQIFYEDVAISPFVIPRARS